MIYADNIEATKITSDWYFGCIIPLIKFRAQKKKNMIGKKNIKKIKLVLIEVIVQSVKIRKHQIKKKYETWK